MFYCRIQIYPQSSYRAYLILVSFRMIKGIFKSYSNFNLHRNLSVWSPPLTGVDIFKYSLCIHSNRQLSAGQFRFRVICPAVPLSVHLSCSCPYNEKMLKKLSPFIQNSYKIFSLYDLIKIKSSIFYLLFIVNISQKVNTSVCLSNIILLSLMLNTSFNCLFNYFNTLHHNIFIRTI